jgi:sialidase-1
MKCYLLFSLILIFNGHAYAQKDLNNLYKSGEEGYKCFRIPALVLTSKGTLLAFAEGRKNNCGDAGDIDLVVKRSQDGGKSWSALRVVWDDSANTCGNPAPVVDKKTGHIILLSTWNLGTDHEKDIINQTSKDSRRIFVLRSEDDGLNWSTAVDITKDVKLPDWTWYATGPGNGIQIKKGKYKNRLVVACDHIEAASKKYYSHAIYSDDHGRSWKLGGTTPQDHVNESTVAEIARGKLLLNMRNFGSARERQTSISSDGGKTWGDISPDTALIEPVCQGNLISLDPSSKKPTLAFSNPANRGARTMMTVRISRDNGKTWPQKKLLYQGPSAYSNLAILGNGNLVCLYEAGIEKPYEGIVFEEIKMEEFAQ